MTKKHGKKGRGNSKIQSEESSATTASEEIPRDNASTGINLPKSMNDHFGIPGETILAGFAGAPYTIPMTGLSFFPMALPSEEALAAELPPSISSVIENEGNVPKAYLTQTQVQALIKEHENTPQELAEGILAYYIT
jgi:hypothetical protein